MKTSSCSLVKLPLLALATAIFAFTPCFGDSPAATTIGIQAESFVSESGNGFHVLADTWDGMIQGGESITTAGGTSSVTYNVTAPVAGDYHLYMRVAVGPGGVDDDSILVPDAMGASPGNWIELNNLADVSIKDVDGNSYNGLEKYFWINVNDSTGSSTAFAQNAQGLLSFEAEHYHNKVGVSNKSWNKISDSSASGAEAMDSSPDNNTLPASPVRMDYKVDFVQTGTHYVWIRGRAWARMGSYGNADSVNIGLNGSICSTSDKMTRSNLGSYQWIKDTADGPRATIQVTQTGFQTVNVFMREDGFVCDKVIITTDPNFTPTGMGPAESPLSNVTFSTGITGNPSLYSLASGSNTFVLGGQEDGFRVDYLVFSTSGDLSSEQLDNEQRFKLERWDNIPHYSVNDLVSSAKFHANADTVTSGVPQQVKFSGTYFGTRLRGHITPKVTGDYTFWLSARNSAQLFISDDPVHGKYAKRPIAALDSSIGTGHGIDSADSNLWDQFSSQRSEPVHLIAGQSYYVEILQQNGHGGNAHVSLAWARDNEARVPLPINILSTYHATPDDADDDYLPDAWETQYGLDPADNGLVDPARQGERGDYDGDGLSNRMEYLLGADPTNPDTDGDGLLDSEEVNSYGTDPTFSDAPSGLVTSTLDLSTYTTTGSSWTLTSPGLIPSSFRGSINWDFSVPSDGIWLLDVATILLGDLYLHETVDIQVLINGVSMGEKTLVYGSNREALLRVFTPYLTAGNHNIGLKINNNVTRRMVGIQSIKVIEPQGADLNSDGIPDWVAAQIMGENALRPYSVTSRTSPANLEGSARMRSQTTLNGNPVTAGLDKSHWYADLALNASAPTAFSVLLEQGFEETGAISWQSTNVFSSETLTIRKGDSLKLIGQALTGPTGQAVTLTFGPVEWDGTPGASGTYDVALSTDTDHHIHTLTAAGNYKVRATLADTSTALMSIIVRKADFSATPKDLLANKIGSLSFSTSVLSASAFFDGGQTVSITNPATLSGSTITLKTAPNQKSGSAHLLARLNEEGPVIGRQSLNLINVSDVLQNDSSFAYTSADYPGYRIIRAPVVAIDLPAGATMVITIFRAGVTFLNGTTVRTLTASDFVNGVHNLEFLFPENMDGGYCHYIDIYDRNGVFLGRR